MTPLRYLLASLWHYRRSHAAVASGVALATAVLTGALLVGDSVRGSLRNRALERLAAVTYALASQAPLRSELVRELRSTEGFDSYFAGSAAALRLIASVTHEEPASPGARPQPRRAQGVQVLGIDNAFWSLDSFPTPGEIPPGAVWVTRALADELQAGVDDEIVLRLPKQTAIPAESTLGEKVDTTIGLRLRIDRVLEPRGLATFGLTPTQQQPRTAFVAQAKLQRALELEGKANLILLAAEPELANGDHPDAWLAEHFHPALEDLGLGVESVGTAGREVTQVESQRLVIPDSIVSATEQALAPQKPQPVVSYLANRIESGGRSIPYSTVAGVDSVPGMGPLFDDAGQPLVLAEDEIVLNRWAADDLKAAVGDMVRLVFYQPESTHGELIEASPLELRLRSIVELTDQNGEPTAANDRRLTPRLEGVTDQRSISDWELPFELVEPIRRVDETYWEQHGPTPKAFVSLALAERLWGTRWGSVSMLRTAADPETVREKLLRAIDPAELGLAWLPLRRQGLDASAGTTPFDVLFLAFSMFLIASALMLIALLTRLSIEARGRELGLLSAMGLTPGRIRGMFFREHAVGMILGAAAGVPLGVAYCALMLWGLRTVWLAASQAPFLQLHVTPTSLAIGLLGGCAAAWIAGFFTLRSASRQSPRGALASGEGGAATKTGRGRPWLAALCGIGLVGSLALGLLGGEQAGPAAFFASGALALVGALELVAAGLRRGAGAATRTGFQLADLARLNVARKPGRTRLTMGLTAAATFLVLAVGAFRLPPTEAGVGGFDLMAEATSPLHFDLTTPVGRQQLGFGRNEAALFEGVRIVPFRAHAGEDASCVNLYKTMQPRVLGAPHTLAAAESATGAGFAWAAVRADEKQSPWRALRCELPPNDRGEPVTPVVLDANTAMYGLKLYGGVGERFEVRDSANRPATLEVVGLLSNSVLQGDLIVDEQALLKLFPESTGARLLLIDLPAGAEPDLADRLTLALEDRLADYGVAVGSTRSKLAALLAVQNTYISTFQSLGGLGLLLGLVGLAVVQLRNLIERRSEVALLRAQGYSRGRVNRLVLLENLLMVGGGLGVGAVAAAIALVPQMFGGGASDARVPWLEVPVLLGSLALAGLGAAHWATRGPLRAPLFPALRGD